ncbi:MAG: CubicO group peptidase (beta-lactamase class C family) [Phenylobacterium sp.]|jgi:CubicO group peptidase (beta-lactamase class C family)
MMKLYKAIISLVSFSLLVSCSSIPIVPSNITDHPVIDIDVAAIDKIFDEWLPTEPGCTVGITYDEALVFAKGYGKANLENDIDNSRYSQFRIASVTKQFTAMAIALLAEDNPSFNLDDTLDQHFDGFPDYAKKITVADLVYHTSGLRDYLYLWALRTRPFYFSEAFNLALLKLQPHTNFVPGSQWEYSNTNYFLLELLVKKVSGMSLNEYAQRHIFKKLHMKNSQFDGVYTNLIAKRAIGHQRKHSIDGTHESSIMLKNFSSFMTTLTSVGPGGLNTSMYDMSLWTTNLLNNKLGINKEALITLFLTPGKNTDSNHGGIGLGYAFGIIKEVNNKVLRYRHSGGFVGYNTSMLVYPKKKTTVTVFCNRWPPEAQAYPKANEIAAILGLGGLPVDDERHNKDKVISTEYIGSFWDHQQKKIYTVSVQDHKLVLKYLSRLHLHRTEAFHLVQENEFHRNEHTGAQTISYSEDKQNITIVTANNKALHASRIKPTQPQTTGTEAFKGYYFAEELQTCFYLDYNHGIPQLELLTNGSKIPLLLNHHDDNQSNSPDKYYGTLYLPFEIPLVIQFRQPDSNHSNYHFLLTANSVIDMVFSKEDNQQCSLLDIEHSVIGLDASGKRGRVTKAIDSK